MQLIDLIGRTLPPKPWVEGDNIPWHEPEFSARMLREHLSQEHDAASRRAVTIDRQVRWIHETLLGGLPSRVLDLGCGPGLYSSRLAHLGHSCLGIDYSLASIAYARAEAQAAGLACRYELADLRQASFGTGFDLALLIFGELNVFRPTDAAALLTRAHDALRPGGALVLEAHTFAAVETIGTSPPTWSSAPAGLFADAPYLLLAENFWDAEARAATTRYYVVDVSNGEVTHYAQSFQAYTARAYDALLRDRGFTNVAVFPALTGSKDQEQQGMVVLVAQR
jgi:SAM-dependent methyltransferase